MRQTKVKRLNKRTRKTKRLTKKHSRRIKKMRGGIGALINKYSPAALVGESITDTGTGSHVVPVRTSVP
jgi:hypothetical protein